ncbi:hypothetical protein CsSME_00015688 [Camellia sinensis var. sinensis]
MSLFGLPYWCYTCSKFFKIQAPDMIPIGVVGSYRKSITTFDLIAIISLIPPLDHMSILLRRLNILELAGLGGIPAIPRLSILLSFSTAKWVVLTSFIMMMVRVLVSGLYRKVCRSF